MSYTDRKITQAEINAHHVQGATDYLIGNPQQNKAVFDNLPEFIAGKFNDLIDEIAGQHGDEIRVAVDEWLAEHPEATTTVQDNSLTTAKYVDGSVTEPKIAEGAVTPSRLDRAYSTPADLASVKANLTNGLNVLDARMDEFASLPEGSTSGNAELLDIRVGANGETYPSAGDAVRGQVADLKSDLNTDVDLLNNYEAELYDSTRTTDGYYPTVTGDGAGQLFPSSNAGTTHWIKIKDVTKIVVNAQTGGAHNFAFYDENKEYVFGFVQNLSVGTPWEYVIPFVSHPNIYYMRAAFHLTEKSTFSIVGYANCYDVESVSKEIGKSPENTYDFAEGATPQNWSVTNIETFWMTNNPEMVALRGQRIKSIRLNIKTSGTTLTIRGYDEEIPMDLSPGASNAMARQANANGYDMFRITNATAGWSTYLLDGSDDRVEIIDDSLICPMTIGLCKAGDTGVFQFYYTSAISTKIYFTHRSMDSIQMHESKLGVIVVGEFDNALNLRFNRSNNDVLRLFITPNDLYKLIEKDQSRFTNKKMNCLGDSITFGYIPDSGAQMANPYPNIIKTILGLAECRNYGISGSTLAVNSGNYQPMCIRYADMDDDADIVLVFGGTNDYGRAVYTPDLGSITDNVNTSVYGALNILCEGLITKYPKAFIFLCTPLKRADKTGANGGGYTLEDVANAIREVGQKFGMPVLDLNYKGGFYIGNATFRAQYGGNDKLHPNQAFDSEHLAPMIASFIESNM